MAIIPAAVRRSVFIRAKRLLGEKKARDLQNVPFRFLNRFRQLPCARVGTCILVPDDGVYVSGWVVDPADAVASVEIVIGSSRLRIDDKWERVSRPKVAARFRDCVNKPDVGFACYIPTSLNLDTSARSRIVLTLNSGKKLGQKIRVSCATREALPFVKAILSAVPSVASNKRELFDKAYGPGISAIWSRRDCISPAFEQIDYNEQLRSSKPGVSVVIPIYGRYDFIEYQLSQFVNDPAMATHELLYVIDDPRIHAEVKQCCETWEKLYQIHFRVVYLERNLGYAGANNTGVGCSTAETILLLNSDVMPAENGWLSRMYTDFLGDTAPVLHGAVLLYEDFSIQHHGMEFFKSPFVHDFWTNIHPGKGFPAQLLSQQQDQDTTGLASCEAVTGACIMLARSTYQKLGGFDESYILGDYEDSDLCMKARKSEIAIKLNKNIKLFHLERQSQSLVPGQEWKRELTIYNCWLHTQRWDRDISELKKQGVVSA